MEKLEMADMAKSWLENDRSVAKTIWGKKELAVILQQDILERKQWVTYRVPTLKESGGELIAPEKVINVIGDELRAYILKGETPAAEIAPAIMNLTDDLLSSNRINIRPGDYIMIQNYIRQSGK